MNAAVCTVTEAARNFTELVQRARYQGESTVLTMDGIAVARIVPESGPVAEPRPLRIATGAELAVWWRDHVSLPPEEADAFASDVEASHKVFLPLTSPWD